MVAKELIALEVATRMVGQDRVSEPVDVAILVEKVRECGLCKDISKHQMDPS
jgi:hypothetical protein